MCSGNMNNQTQVDINYKKTDSRALFESASKIAGFTAAQSYTPLLNQLFNLSGNNCNRLVLSHPSSITELKEKKGENVYICEVEDKHGATSYKTVFFKYSPIQDPLTYLVGDDELQELPYFGACTESKSRANSPNNAAYVDAFFTYLTTWLADSYHFPNATSCYGSFIGSKKAFLYNLEDDYDTVASSEYFIQNPDRKYTATESTLALTFAGMSLSNKAPLTIGEPCSIPQEGTVDDPLLVYTASDDAMQRDDASSSVCSSRSSGTDSDGEAPSGSDDSLTDDDDSMSDESIAVSINNFPVHAIALEKLEGTLDELLMREKHPMGGTELTTTLLQVVMSLIAYQKTFMLTHNDLHTSNIMYSRTEKTHLLYKVHGAYFKVPTFGKVWKIIDFGRATYWANGQLYCSDSYFPGGDAATQYNFGDFYNESKAKVVPNCSFDLCRLACSLFDITVDEEDCGPDMHLVNKLITDWCTDDKGRNILYKTNGMERYPDFKLYKMIARSVHKHIPSQQLQRPIFQRYCVPQSKLKKTLRNVGSAVDIDSLPTCPQTYDA